MHRLNLIEGLTMHRLNLIDPRPMTYTEQALYSDRHRDLQARLFEKLTPLLQLKPWEALKFPVHARFDMQRNAVVLYVEISTYEAIILRDSEPDFPSEELMAQLILLLT